MTRKARNENGEFRKPETFISTGSQITIVLRRAGPANEQEDVEFIDGAYIFHDEEHSGTLQPLSLCDTYHYGLSSLPNGNIEGLGMEHLYWNIEGTLICSHNFVPGTNQSVTLTVCTWQLCRNEKMHENLFYSFIYFLIVCVS